MRRIMRLLVLLWPLLVGAAATSWADPKPAIRFETPGRPVEIPFDLHNNHICLRGRLNDSDSLWFVLDTGASGHSMNASRAKSLGLEIRGGGEARGSGGRVESGRVSDVTVRLPGLTLSHQVLSTLPLDAIGLQTGRDMDVIIGYPLLRECVVEVDYATRVVRVWEARAAPERKIGASIPLQLIEHLPYVQASVQLPSGKALEGRFLIDTGAMTALMLSAPFVETHRVLAAIDTTIQVRLGGVGGPVENPLGRLQSVRLGPYVLARPVTAFRTPGRGSISAEGTAGNIGGEILRRFRVTFDYPRKRMTLEANEGLGDPFEADMTGIMFRVDSTRALRVVGVQPGSPAAEAGIAGDDVIEQVDGRTVAEIGVQSLRPMFRRPGHSYRLTVRRGDERRDVVITTRRLI